jgi:ACS family glucarate transporter-like MFS transporter
MFALMFPNFAALAVVLGVFAWTPIFLTSTLHFSDTYTGEILAFIGVMNILGCYAGAFLSRRLGKRVAIAVSMVLLAVFSVMLGFSDSGLAAVIWISGVGFAGTLYFAADFALIPYAASQGVSVAGVTFGVFNTFSNVGGFISPILLGVVLDYTRDFALGFGTLGVFASLGLLGAVMLRTDRLTLNQ